ncbi:NMDA receptor-regulated protein 1-domain-containing protein [Leucosporidium creatinivorum]|uniref:NMDA receptor-regulated protein 1-domain-containing protein n=1 Tax=Leucosporidium creatinivorum TaxID=106004 RepID=A0A1Y2FXV2_9BASI|nr:NMDA receptor-regulated protein 1-domain-containing protein [Leucosporidium creatinivorum]
MAPRKKPSAKAPVKPAAAAQATAQPQPIVPAPKGPVDNRALPKKESELFRQVLQLYETKQFTTGLKTVNQILENFPDHGESLAMKGIFLSCTGQKPLGYETVKRGVAKDSGSHIVWHVYALILRADKNFEEALKCYKKAVAIEPDSMSLMNDLAMLSVHLRYYAEYAAARLSILRSQPRVRRNWVYLAVAQHLAGQHWEADRTLTHFEKMLRDVPDREYEYGEILMYHAMVLEESGDLERTLEFLSEQSGQIVDRTAYSVQRAHILLKLGRLEAADWAWEVILEENPDSYEYIKASVLAKGADCDAKTEEGRAKAVEILDKLAEKYPRSLAIRRISLELVSGADFRTRAFTYLTNALSKGIPSVFADIKSLYTDKEKCQIIGELAEAFRQGLEEKGNFGAAEDDDTVESSTTYLWTLYFLAQHHSALSNHSAALSLLSLASTHTPSLPELHMLRARVLKRAGDEVGAMNAMQEARELDGQDRFLNSKCAKYLVRAEKIKEAEEVLGLFTKKDAPSPLEDLIDMQCLWILEEEAKSFIRQNNHALALKRYHQIFKTFHDIEEDQYDFHSYCIRKGTLRAYIQLLRYNDTLRSHPSYVAGAKGAIEIYLRLHDDPSSIQPPALTNGEAEEERKRLEEEEKRVREKKEREEKDRLEAERIEREKKLSKQVAKDKGKKVADKKPEPEKEVDDEPAFDLDPRGLQLLKAEEPLVEALKFLRPLQKEAPKEVETWFLTFEIAMRREKYLQALRALRSAYALSPSHPSLRPLITRFAVLVRSSSFASTQNEFVTSTISTELPELLGGLELEQFVVDGLQKSEGAEQVLGAARSMLELRGKDGEKKEVEELVFQLLREEVAVKVKPTLDGLRLLNSFSSPRADEYRQLASQRFPLARVFKTAEELAALDAKAEVKSEDQAGKEVVEE